MLTIFLDQNVLKVNINKIKALSTGKTNKQKNTANL